MLLQKATDSTTVMTFKTFAGEEIITRVAEETDTYYKLTKPLVMIATPQGGFGLAPAVFSISPTDSPMLNKSAVALYGPTDKDIANQYLAKTTGLTLATSI